MIRKIDLDMQPFCKVWNCHGDAKRIRKFVAEIDYGRCIACTNFGSASTWNHYELCNKEDNI